MSLALHRITPQPSAAAGGTRGIEYADPRGRALTND
jgi:hypothetical protein